MAINHLNYATHESIKNSKLINKRLTLDNISHIFCNLSTASFVFTIKKSYAGC